MACICLSVLIILCSSRSDKFALESMDNSNCQSATSLVWEAEGSCPSDEGLRRFSQLNFTCPSETTTSLVTTMKTPVTTTESTTSLVRTPVTTTETTTSTVKRSRTQPTTLSPKTNQTWPTTVMQTRSRTQRTRYQRVDDDLRVGS